MFEVIAAVVVVVAALVATRMTVRRERQRVAARRRRAQYAAEFEAGTGMYAPVARPGAVGQAAWVLAR